MSHRSIVRCSAVAALVALSVGCASTRVTRFEANEPHSQRTPASLIRFYGSTKPGCPYAEIARITAESGLFVSWNRVVKAARNAAHEIGGDALIDVQEGKRLAGATVSPAGVAIEEKTSLSGVVIRFKHVDCME